MSGYTPTTKEVLNAALSYSVRLSAVDFDCWLAARDARITADAVEDAIAFLATTPATTITGKGGAVERLRSRAVSGSGENNHE